MPEPTLAQRLRERKLVQWALAYLAGAWVAIEVTGEVVDRFGWPGVIGQVVIILALFGFFITLILAWYHGEKGRQRVSGLELLMVAGVLVVAGSALWLVGRRGESLGFGEDLVSARAAPEFSLPPLNDQLSVAALPWMNLSEREEDLDFALGVHDEILTRLHRVGGLKVTSRQSVMRFRDSSASMREIAQELGVRYILEGTLLRAGEQVRINVQLIEATTDIHVWTEIFDRLLSTENLLAVQSEIALRVAEEIGAVITPEERERVSAPLTGSRQAYEEYFRGRLLSSEHLPANYHRAIEHFERAIQADPGFSAAFAGLGFCYKELARLSLIPSEEGYSTAKQALREAIRLDPINGEAYATLASIRFVADWEMTEPDSLFRQAMALSPGSADVRIQYSQYLNWVGRSQESVALAEQALELDPFTGLTSLWLTASLFFAERFEESAVQGIRTRGLDPDLVWAPMYLSHAHTLLRQPAEARAYADTVGMMSRALGEPTLIAFAAANYAEAGMPERTREILSSSLGFYEGGELDPMPIARMYVSLGEVDEAFVWLNRVLEERSGLAVYMRVYGRTFMKGIADDPRYRALMGRIGLEE